MNNSESKELTSLMKAIGYYLDADNERFESDETDFQLTEFTITIGERTSTFILGGPQAEALYEFIEHIAAENWYTVDYDRREVICNL